MTKFQSVRVFEINSQGLAHKYREAYTIKKTVQHSEQDIRNKYLVLHET